MRGTVVRPLSLVRFGRATTTPEGTPLIDLRITGDADSYEVRRRDDGHQGVTVVLRGQGFSGALRVDLAPEVALDLAAKLIERLVAATVPDDEHDLAQPLAWTLRRLGDEYGPLGVALAAVEFTDRQAVVLGLLGDAAAAMHAPDDAPEPTQAAQ